MATFTITANQNIDELTGKTGGDIYNINGGNLTIDQHSRFGLNNANTSATAATSMGSITLSATLGGTCTIDGRKVRLISYTGGSGTLPAMGSLVTQGGASGKIMCVTATLTSVPVTSGAIPASGYIHIKQWNDVEYAAGALTLSGITANSSGASVVGYLEIFGDESSTVNANRLGTFNVYGAWYRVGTTNGTSNQTMQIPNNGTLKHIAGVFIEKTSGQGDYEFYPNAGTTTTTGTEAARGKVVWIDNTGLVRIGNSGAATNGYTPPAGLAVVVPNVFLQNCTATARNAEVIPNATVATRYDFTTTGGGVVNIDKANLAWYPSFSQAYSVQMNNSGIVDALLLSEIATPMNWSKVGVGNKPTTALLTSPLTLQYCYAGGTFTDCVFARVSLATSGSYTTVMQDIAEFTFTRCTIRANTIQGNATVYSIYGTRMKNCEFVDTIIIEAAVALITCDDVNFTNTTYINCVSGATVTTYAVYVWNLSSNTINCTFSGLNFGGLTNVHPYTAILIGATGCSGIKVRNIGTRATPLNMGSANACGLIYTVASNCSDFKFQRIYVSNTRTGIMTGDNSCHEFVEENVFGDYADAVDVMAILNMYRKGMGGTGALTAQTSVYGTHWSDRFTSTTAGRLAILMNEPTELTASQVTLANGANFTSAGGLYMPVIGMSATFEMPYYALGHTQFANSALVMAGGTATNYTYEFAIDKNDGAGWSTMTTENYTPTTLGTALNAIGALDASKGFKLRLKITTTVTNTTAITSVYMTTVSTTTAQDYQYPLDTATVNVTNLVSGSRVKATKASDGTVLFSGVESSGSVSFQTEYIGAINIEARKASASPYYIAWVTQITSISGQTVSATALQQLDE